MSDKIIIEANMGNEYFEMFTLPNILCLKYADILSIK